MFTGDSAHILQAFQVAATILGIIGTLIGLVLAHILKCLRELRHDIKHEHDHFEAFVRNESCKMHREIIAKHIEESEARIERMLSHCKNNKEDGIG